MKTLRESFHLSHSSLALWNSCERKWLLSPMSVRENSHDTEFGTDVGIAFQEYMVSKNEDLALFELILNWNWEFSDSKNRKTFWNAMKSLELLVGSFPVDEFKVWEYEGRPATEFGFEIVLQDSDPYISFVGFIDVILERIYDGKLFPLDVKTTGLAASDENLRANYANEGQLQGYQVVLHAIAPERQSDEVIYLVAQFPNTHTPVVHDDFIFSTSRASRLEFLTQLCVDKDRILSAIQQEFFPKRGNACLAYGKVCQHFGTCEFPTMVQEAMEHDRSERLEQIRKKIHFTGHVDDLIAAQLES